MIAWQYAPFNQPKKNAPLRTLAPLREINSKQKTINQKSYNYGRRRIKPITDRVAFSQIFVPGKMG
jgi:hypothetical protein